MNQAILYFWGRYCRKESGTWLNQSDLFFLLDREDKRIAKLFFSDYNASNMSYLIRVHSDKSVHGGFRL